MLAAPARDLTAAIPLVEALIGRPLRLAEQAIDVIRLDQALEQAKDELEQAIRAEMVAGTSAWKSGLAVRPAVRVTPEMLAILERLRQIGREEAFLELDRLGYTGVRRSYAAEPAPEGRDVAGYLARNLGGVTTRIEDELVATDLSAASRGAVAQALLKVPGARDIASRVISTAMIDGLASTWDENADLVSEWEYTAVLDGGTCDRCAPLDGKRYRTLEALYLDLPNFGPNPLCLGGGRCRCRAVPVSTDEAPQHVAEPDPIESLDPDLPGWRRELSEIAARITPRLEAFGRFGEAAPSVEDLLDAGLLDRRLRPTGGHDYFPGPVAGDAEQEILRAGEIIDRELDDRTFDRVADRQIALGQARQAADAAKPAHEQASELYRTTRERFDIEERELRDRLREGFLAQGMTPSEAFRAVLESPEYVEQEAGRTARLAELSAARSDALRAVSEARQEVRRIAGEVQQIKRDALREILDEHRGMGPGDSGGWQFSTGGRRGQAKQILDEAADLFPTDWIVRGRANAMKPRFTRNGRGFHRDGNPSDIVVSGGNRSKIPDDPEGFATAIHELGHHLELVDPRLRGLQWTFFQRRTRADGYGDQEREFRFPRGAGYGSHETYRPDRFVEQYMGKTYGNGPRSNYELLTMGLESVWTGSYELDLEMRRFLLGILATM